MPSNSGCGSTLTFDQLDDEDAWTSSPFAEQDASKLSFYTAMKDFESTLHCSICREFFKAPVSLAPCHHSFCSECIRKTISCQKTNMKRSCYCPVCRVPINVSGADMKCLTPNRTLEDLAIQFQSLRPKLKSELINATTINSREDREVEVQKPSASALESVPAARSATSSQERCNVSLSKDEMKASKEGKLAPPEPLTMLRNKLPLPVYGTLKRGRLAEMCSEAGLPTNGTPKELTVRHKSYVTLYNAESDSYTPRSAHEIANEIIQRERTIKEERKQQAFSGVQVHSKGLARLKQNLKDRADSENLASARCTLSGNKQFDDQLNAGFKRLMEQAQARRPQKAAKVSCVPGSTDESATAVEESTNKGGLRLDSAECTAETYGLSALSASKDAEVDGESDITRSMLTAAHDAPSAPSLVAVPHPSRPPWQPEPVSRSPTDGKLPSAPAKYEALAVAKGPPPVAEGPLSTTVKQMGSRSTLLSMEESTRAQAVRTISQVPKYHGSSPSASAFRRARNLKRPMADETDETNRASKHRSVDSSIPPAGLSSTSTPSSPSENEKSWTCSKCTFVNERKKWSRTRPVCQVCGNPRLRSSGQLTPAEQFAALNHEIQNMKTEETLLIIDD